MKVKHAWAFLKFRKSGLVQHLLHELKYNNHPEVGVRIGMLFGKELLEYGFKNEFDLIVPVPLHISRQRKRGYNQSAKFAEGLSNSLEIPWDESISIRKRRTDTQTRKSRLDRWENVKDVFDVEIEEKVFNKRILLVDDVITTGATLEACGHHLLKSKCSELSIACIAEAQ
ncbi:MAG: ComF family protein [Bacteroidia bacterium]|nr:ComF family protein [Bacteroidia bacterium]